MKADATRPIAALQVVGLSVAAIWFFAALDASDGFEFDLPPRACSSINLVNNGTSVFGKNLDNTYSTGGLILINKRGVERFGRGVK